VKSGEPALLSGELVKDDRQLAWHVDRDAVTAVRLHDLPSLRQIRKQGGKVKAQG
jgi:hypothetical protein